MEAAQTRVNPLAGAERTGHVAQMTGKDKEREIRLAAALRENLRRRKAQSRDLDEVKEDKKSDG
jgi:hypothetical protein